MNTMINKVTPRTLSGFMELSPRNQICFNQLYEKTKNAYERFGFLPLDTPILEAAEILEAKEGGETSKQIYKFKKGDTNIAMRFDLTVPLAKYVTLHQSELAFPFKRYQIGKVYRGEHAQQGRFREFYQADIDIIGIDRLDIMYDAEIPSVINNTLIDLNIGDFIIKMNNRKISTGFLQELELNDKANSILIILDKIDKIGNAAAIKELEKIDIKEHKIKLIMEFVSIGGTNADIISKLKLLSVSNEQYKLGIDELEKVLDGVNKLGVPVENISIDLKIVRGLGYYTGTVYETFLKGNEKIGSIASGGRYEDLATFYTDKKMPGVGMSIGLTRLYDQLSRIGIINAKRKSIADVIIIPMTENIGECMQVAAELRQNDINTEIYFENKKIGQKFAYADKLKIPMAIVIGDEEIAQKKYSLKDMDTGLQEMLELNEIIAKIKNN